MLEPTKDVVLKEYDNEKDSGIDLDLILPSFCGLPFYNISRYTLDTLGGTNTRANLEDYISKFSTNVRVIFEEFGFINTIHELDKARLLYRMTRQFAAIDLHPEMVSDQVMSNAYDLVPPPLVYYLSCLGRCSAFMNVRMNSRWQLLTATIAVCNNIFSNKNTADFDKARHMP